MSQQAQLKAGIGRRLPDNYCDIRRAYPLGRELSPLYES